MDGEQPNNNDSAPHFSNYGEKYAHAIPTAKALSDPNKPKNLDRAEQLIEGATPAPDQSPDTLFETLPLENKERAHNLVRTQITHGKR